MSTKLMSITQRAKETHIVFTSEESDEGKLHVRFCGWAHSNLGVITPEGGAL